MSASLPNSEFNFSHHSTQIPIADSLLSNYLPSPYNIYGIFLIWYLFTIYLFNMYFF